MQSDTKVRIFQNIQEWHFVKFSFSTRLAWSITNKKKTKVLNKDRFHREYHRCRLNLFGILTFLSDLKASEVLVVCSEIQK